MTEPDVPPNPAPDELLAAVVIVVRPVADPMTRTHGVTRPPEYRLRLALKALLRGYGLRAKVVRDPTPAELAAAGEPVGEV